MLQQILTERLALRTLEASDADAVHAYRVEPEVARYQNWPFSSVDGVHAFFARQHGADLFALNDWFQIGITLRDTGEVIGDFGLRARDNDRRQVELGITLAQRFQRRGFGAEALSALLEFLFIQTCANRIYCSTDPRNGPCLRLLERAGFRREAHLIESLWINGEWVDDMIFALLRSEWKARRCNEGAEPKTSGH
ncbi:MAG TPA: GNAT family protein [Opitutaceae bacterium]|nr:GNAT family protein [Opitutaceae bacterium]